MSEEKKRTVSERRGTLRAIRPHRREDSQQPASPSAAPAGGSAASVAQIVDKFTRSLPGGSLGDTCWGKNLSKKEEAARKYFHVPASEKVHLILDTTILGSCKVGFAICDTGIYARDERGEKVHITWKALHKAKIAFDGSVLTIDSYRFLSQDGEELQRLLAQLQKELH